MRDFLSVVNKDTVGGNITKVINDEIQLNADVKRIREEKEAKGTSIFGSPRGSPAAAEKRKSVAASADAISPAVQQEIMKYIKYLG